MNQREREILNIYFIVFCCCFCVVEFPLACDISYTRGGETPSTNISMVFLQFTCCCSCFSVCFSSKIAIVFVGFFLQINVRTFKHIHVGIEVIS